MFEEAINNPRTAITTTSDTMKYKMEIEKDPEKFVGKRLIYP